MLPAFTIAASEDSHVITSFPIKTFENLPVVFFPPYMGLFFLYTRRLRLLKKSKSWANITAFTPVNTKLLHRRNKSIAHVSLSIFLKSDSYLIFKRRDIIKHNVRYFSGWRGQEMRHLTVLVKRPSNSAWWLFRIPSSRTNSRYFLNCWP